ncbi:MAG: lysophospholipase [Spirochaetia bacterium]|jgi:alpha-beta hydrolase superfamily lysophospholipase
MKHEEYSWKAKDGLEMFAQSWAPDARPRAVIALVHGLGEHSGRYPLLVERLPGAGYAINAYDLRGHGRTGGPRLYASSFEVLMEDIERHIDQTRLRFPGVPLFLYGHSLGGEQVLYYVLRRSPSLHGVIATSPLLAPGTPVSPFKVAVSKLLSRIIPSVIITTKVPWESLSGDPAVIELTKKDPLYQEGISVRMGVELLRAGEWIRSQTTFPLPLLVMQGTADRHVDPKKTIQFSQGLTGDVTLKVWEGGHHELHNDLGREKVADLILDWLGKHSGTLP